MRKGHEQGTSTKLLADTTKKKESYHLDNGGGKHIIRKLLKTAWFCPGRTSCTKTKNNRAIHFCMPSVGSPHLQVKLLLAAVLGGCGAHRQHFPGANNLPLRGAEAGEQQHALRSPTIYNN